MTRYMSYEASYLVRLGCNLFSRKFFDIGYGMRVTPDRYQDRRLILTISFLHCRLALFKDGTLSVCCSPLLLF